MIISMMLDQCNPLVLLLRALPVVFVKQLLVQLLPAAASGQDLPRLPPWENAQPS